VKPVSVVIPVKDAGALFERVLEAVRAQGDLELIVIDSGSRDHSREIARSAGAELIEIASADFGHGRTRNLGAERASGELIAFLTQDAVPTPRWLDALRDAFELDPRVGAAFGPHLPFDDTSPMIARELTEFFDGFAPNRRPVIHRRGDLTFLSNVNAAYARGCWDEIRFADVAYSEDQAFGRAMLEAGWAKVYHPDAAVLHAHDYGPVEFMKRYFDEYRGLRETSGHIESLRPLDAVREVVRDGRWMRRQGLPAAQRARWLARSAVHHSGRRVASALGSRAEQLPAAVQRRASLEGTVPGPDPPAVSGAAVPAMPGAGPYEEILRLSREGPAPLRAPVAGSADSASLHLAIVIPPFTRGSGGHNTIFTLVDRLEAMGHSCTIWIYDPRGRHFEADSVLRRRIVDEFVPVRAPVFKGFRDWHGADVAVATGWDTAYQIMLLPGCGARVYLINDHEPEFFGTSAESLWAARTYELGVYGISASRWLRDLLARKYGQRGNWFRLGVDHDVYRPRAVERRRDTILFYSRIYTPRRAVPLGGLALEELLSRRPELRVVAFGHDGKEPLGFQFPFEQLGVVGPERLALAYSEATLGLCLSLTNYSLLPQEMMACGLPCVDLAGSSTEAELGHDAGVEYADADPVALADAMERLISDDALWARRSEAGLAMADTASWDLAARQVESGLRQALREREAAAVPGS
jgi:GT2 family glycosyltransferase/glycosyltransferase involved in cell wall biosynthesis